MPDVPIAPPATGPPEGWAAVGFVGPAPPTLPPPRTTWAKSATRVYSMLQSKWPLRALSHCTRGKEPKMIENRQNKAGFSGVCRCEITTYDKESEVLRGALSGGETSKTSTNLNRTSVQYRWKWFLQS